MPLFLFGKSCGQRSLAGYSPWSHEESDTIERLSFILNLRQLFLELYSPWGCRRVIQDLATEK